MIGSNQVFTVATKSSDSSRFRTMRHQVRMEIVAKSGKKSLDVASILSELMIRANEKETVDFIDANANPFDTSNFPEAEEFKDRLAAETVETRDSTKVTLGFFMISSANMQRIKLSIGFSWLTQQQIYLRIQRMPFKHGTDLYLMGYATMIHPMVANPTDVEDDIRTKWYSPIDKLTAEHDPNEDDKKFLENVTRLEEANLIIDDTLQIPISVERTTIKVSCPEKKPFEVPVYQVYIPRRYRDAANYLNDRALLETMALKNFIPFSVAKNDRQAFYPQMVNHAKFLHTHRSLVIKAVPPSDYATVKSTKPINQSLQLATLKSALMANKLISGVHEKFDNRAITLSITEDNLMTVKTWLTTVLPLYPYRPLVSVSDPSNSQESTNGNSVRTGKYSKLFTTTNETDTTADNSFDPSTISSVRTPRTSAWNQGPPLNVTFDRRARSVTLNTQSNTRTYYSAQRGHPNNETNMHDSDEESDSTPLTRPSSSSVVDVKELVAQALAEERAKLDTRLSELERKQEEFLERTLNWEQKLVDMRKQIVDATVSGTISVLSGTHSPFATKADTQQLRNDNAAEFQSLKESILSTTNGVTVLQTHMTLLLQRTEHLFAAAHDPDIKSPPRKARATDLLPADSPMTDVEGVGEE